MSFDEKFPSLKYELLDNQDCWSYNEDVLFILKSEVEKCCLDKEVVRKAIINYIDNGGSPSFAKEIFKKLGLEAEI